MADDARESETPVGDADIEVAGPDIPRSRTARRRPVEAPDPVVIIEHVMEARGYRRKDVAAATGSQPRASGVLNRRLSR